MRIQRTTLVDLKGQGILDLVRAVLALCRDTNRTVDWVNCSAQGVSAAIVNEPERLQKAMRTGGLTPKDLAFPNGLDRLAGAFVPEVVAEGLQVQPGVPVRLEVLREQGVRVGSGELMLKA